MENLNRLPLFDPIKVVSKELKPDRQPSFTNGDSDSSEFDMCNERISNLAFQAAYMDTLHLTRLPSGD